MSDTTNTPNGGSKKDLYSQNQDTGKIEINFPEDFINIKDPDKEQLGDMPGSGVNSEKPVQRDSGDIEKVGYVGIPVQVLTPEIKKSIEDRTKRSQELHDKIEADKLADKNNDGIDDRNQ